MSRLPAFPPVVDDVTVRLIAGVVLVVSLVVVATGAVWLYGLLAVDFALRAGFGPKASPVAQLVSSLVRPRVPAAPRPTPGAPKRFAATIGAVMTLAAVVLFYPLGWTTAAWVAVGVMVVFPALEALAGLCVGCQLFAVLMRTGLVPESVCLDCADITRRQRVPTP